MDLPGLFKLINTHFSLEEVRTLCFTFAFDYDNLGGEGKQAKVRELILELLRRGDLPQLVDAVAAARPHISGVAWAEAREAIITIQTAFPTSQPDISDPFALAMVVPPFQAPPRIVHFTGRQPLLTQVADLLQQVEGATGIVGLVGIGGAGKTSLAVEIAHKLRETFPDGVLWADLAASTPESELESIAAAFGQAKAVAQRPDLPNKAEFVRQILANKQA